ncbi:MAG: deoxyribodipyrimidine photo-lyase/cryptochrome family protein [Pseudomonadota bacterium]
MPQNQIVWFKRDLRILDHLPLANALARGPTLALYVLEPGLWAKPDRSWKQWQFLRGCLDDLDARLRDAGGSLTVVIGDVVGVLDQLNREHATFTLHAHEETGNDWTFRRDIRVADWCAAHGVEFVETPQFGVFRRLAKRDGWARRWRTHMQQPLTTLGPTRRWLRTTLTSDSAWRDWVPPVSPEPGFTPRTGRHVAEATLHSFLLSRGEQYQNAMSSPLTAEAGCSRLSADLAHGTLSMRELTQSTWRRQEQIRALAPPHRGHWGKSLHAFQGRLHWHCHFIQKLESEPRIEFENLVRAYDGLRETEFDQLKFDAWCEGRTGYPFVDACMRSLAATGWLNFRMRAMLVSFAAYDLWLHWREPSLHLARLFVDYEPGIHYSQMQMQSGTTGMNTVRIYNPIKQSSDHDPNGEFIRRWIPELAPLPDETIHQPWQTPATDQQRLGCVIGKHYPTPIVDHGQAARIARSRVYAVRRTPKAREESKAVVERHASRRRARR